MVENELAKVWDDKLGFDGFSRLAGQFKRGEITLDDFWFLLGGDSPDEAYHRPRRKTDKRPKVWSGQYLIRESKTDAPAHLWKGSDTVCRMYSTGGMRSKNSYSVFETSLGRHVCGVCQQKM